MVNQGHWSAGDEGTAEKLNSALLQRGTAAARPAAGEEGREYFATDTSVLSRDNGTTWDVIPITPSGMIAFFTGSCPTGWTEYTTARGRYIVGTPSGGTAEGTKGTALSDLEDRAVGQHTHTFAGDALADHDHDLKGVINASNVATIAGSRIADHNGYHATGTINQTFHADTIADKGAGTPSGTNANSGSVASTNAPYVQLTACKKD